MTTWHPAWANFNAVARPTPRAAPVMTATLFSMSIGSLSVGKPEIGQVFRDAWIGEDLLVQGLGRALPYSSRHKKPSRLIARVASGRFEMA